MNAICSLIDVLLRESRKKASEFEDSEFSLEHLRHLKKFYEINALCALETFHHLQFLGFESAGVAILKLLQCFKMQTTDILKAAIKLFKVQGIKFNSDFFGEEEEKETKKTEEKTEKVNKKRQSVLNINGKYEISVQQMIAIKEMLKRNNSQGGHDLMFLGESNSENPYATLERASFYLEQEKRELDELLLAYNNSKDEITEFLDKRANLENINPSGVIKYLQMMLKESKSNTFNLAALLESEKNELESRNNKEDSTKYKVEQIKHDIMEKVEEKTRKIIRHTKDTFKKVGHTMDREIQTIETKESLNDLNQAALGSTSLRKQLATQANDIKELNSKLDYQRNLADQLNQKIFTLEKGNKEVIAEKAALNDKIHTMELKIARKKTKLDFEIRENKDLIEKLGTYVDKDNMSKNLIRGKNDDLDKYKISFREKERDMNAKINSLEQEKIGLDEKVTSLQSEITRLNDLLEIYNTMSSKPSKTIIESETGQRKLRSSEKRDDNSVFFPGVKKKLSMPSVFNEMLSPKKLTIVSNVDNKEMEEQIRANEAKKKKEEELIQKQTIQEEEENVSNKLQREKSISKEIKPEKMTNDARNNENKKIPPNLLIKKKSTLKQSNHSDNKGEALRGFVDAFFSEKEEKGKICQFFEKVSKKVLKSADPDSVFLLVNSVLDQKESKAGHPPKPSLIKQQEMIIKKDKEDHPKVNLKPVTIIKQIISTAPVIEDPMYEEYLRWREENKLEDMVEYIKNKAKMIENFEKNQEKSKKTVNKTPNHYFSSLMKSRSNLKTEENPEKTTILEDKPRGMTSETVFRTRKVEHVPKSQLKAYLYQPKDHLSDFEGSDVFNYSENKKTNENAEDDNFSKKKCLFKYPFRPIDSKFRTENKSNQDLTEKFFEGLYAKLVRQHQKCGPNCGHLKRFYQRIGFVGRCIQKEELAMGKNTIDRVPYLNSFDDLWGEEIEH